MRLALALLAWWCAVSTAYPEAAGACARGDPDHGAAPSVNRDFYAVRMTTLEDVITPVTSFAPDTTYRVTLGAVRGRGYAGFGLTALDRKFQPAGEFTKWPKKAQRFADDKDVGGCVGNASVSHTREHTDRPLNINMNEFEWRSPPAGAEPLGPITFYAWIVRDYFTWHNIDPLTIHDERDNALSLLTLATNKRRVVALTPAFDAADPRAEYTAELMPDENVYLTAVPRSQDTAEVKVNGAVLQGIEFCGRVLAADALALTVTAGDGGVRATRIRLARTLPENTPAVEVDNADWALASLRVEPLPRSRALTSLPLDPPFSSQVGDETVTYDVAAGLGVDAVILHVKLAHPDVASVGLAGEEPVRGGGVFRVALNPGTTTAELVVRVAGSCEYGFVKLRVTRDPEAAARRWEWLAAGGGVALLLLVALCNRRERRPEPITKKVR